MTKIRIYDLAKQIEKESKEIIAALKEHGIEGKTASSSITEEEVELVKAKLLKGASRVENTVKEKAENVKEAVEKTAKKAEKAVKDVEKAAAEVKKKVEEKVSGAGEKNSARQDNKSQNSGNNQNNSHNGGNDNGGRNNGGNRNGNDNGNRNNSGNGNRNGSGSDGRNNSGNDNGSRSDNGNRNNGGNGNNSGNGNRNNGGNRNDNGNRNDSRNNGGNNSANNNGNGTGNKNGKNNNKNRNNNNNNSNGSNGNGHSANNNNNNNSGKKQQGDKQKEKHISKVYNPQNSGSNDKNGNKKNNGKGGVNAAQSKPQPKPQPEPKEEEIKVITIPEIITIGELAAKMKVQASALVKKLFLQGQIVTINNEIEFEQAEEIAMDYDIIAEKEEKVDAIEELLKEDEEDESSMVKRNPVVCVMGHVDHGKTSLLDAIRKTNVISGEAGGITQHIGAYTVECNGENITFLDTPGHEAFTAMRMRGAQATDIAILVVAADDGVMPQTIEAISHAKAAGIEIIVAVNKIDKPSANVEKVKQELAEYELLAEDWGGNTIFVPVSAHTGEGLDKLLEMVLLTAEILELKANPKRKARGIVIEAKLDKGRGSVATVLVQKGTLRVGDAVAAGSCYGRVRAMIDDKGNKVKEAGPSKPVEILGLNNVPNAGEVFVATANEKEARSFAETFISQDREKLLEGARAKSKMSLDDLFTQIQSGDVKELNIIVKADVQGSVEAVKQSLVKLSNDEVVVKIIHGGVGAINESDVSLAAASNAIIIGFNVRPDNQAKDTADREKVDIRLYRVIYQAIEDVEAAMKGMLDPVYEEKIIGHGEVRQLFKASGVGTIAGSYVLDGVFQRGCSVRITREGKQIFEGALASLKRFKDDVKEVKAGYECGLVFDGFNELQELDQVEAYIMVEVPR